MGINFKFKNQEGSILLVTVLVLSSILMISLSASSLAMQSILMNRNQEWSTGAYFAAEAGAEKIIYETWKNNVVLLGLGSCSGDGSCISFVGDNLNDCTGCDDNSTKYTLFNNSYFQIKYTLDADNSITTLDCIGYFHGTRRTVQVKF